MPEWWSFFALRQLLLRCSSQLHPCNDCKKDIHAIHGDQIGTNLSVSVRAKLSLSLDSVEQCNARVVVFFCSLQKRHSRHPWRSNWYQFIGIGKS